MNPQNPNQPPASHSGKTIVNPLSVMQAGEHVICEIKRHPIGVINLFVACGILLILALVMVILAPRFIDSNDSNRVLGIGLAGYIFFAALVMAFVFIANKVYWGNRWILTSDSVTQVTQSSLFSKQSSQLSLGNLEDITAEQNGIFPHMFNYGILKVETAGERSRFVFAYCPKPTYYAQQIIDAREAFEQGLIAKGAQQSYGEQLPPNQPPGPNVNTNTQ